MKLEPAANYLSVALRLETEGNDRPRLHLEANKPSGGPQRNLFRLICLPGTKAKGYKQQIAFFLYDKLSRLLLPAPFLSLQIQELYESPHATFWTK